MPLSIHARRALHHLLGLNKPGYAMHIPGGVCPAEAVASVRRELAVLGIVYADSEVQAADTTLCMLRDCMVEAVRIDANYEEAEMQWALMQAATSAAADRYLTGDLPPVLLGGEPVDIEFAREQIKVLMDADVLTGKRDLEQDLLHARLTRKGKKLLRMEATPDEEATPMPAIGIQVNGDVYGSAFTYGHGNSVHVEFHGQIARALQAVEDSSLDDTVKYEVRSHLEAAGRRPGEASRFLAAAREIAVGALGGAAGDGIVAAIDAASAILPFLP